MDDLEEKIAAGEPLMQQAVDALRRYHEAKGHASPEIGKEMLDQLVQSNSMGLVVVPGDDGLPICVNRESLMSDDELAISLRQRRDALLAESDWVSLRANEAGMPVPAPWLSYHSELRDLPLQPGWPRNIQWPPLPGN